MKKIAMLRVSYYDMRGRNGEEEVANGELRYEMAVKKKFRTASTRCEFVGASEIETQVSSQWSALGAR